MKGLSISAFLLASAGLALVPALSAVYREAYPAEPVKRAALAACAVLDPGFDRLIANARARCYARQLQAPELPVAQPRSEELAYARF
jgi:hypothetical protein